MNETLPYAAKIIELEKRIAELEDEQAEHEHSHDIRWKADMRAIKKWHEAGGDPMTWPDHADLCVWLMERLEKAENAASHVYRDSMFNEGGTISYEALSKCAAISAQGAPTVT